MYVHNNPKKIEVGNLRNMVKKKKKNYTILETRFYLFWRVAT